MWWKAGSGGIQMGGIFTHSKVTESLKSHLKQISAQMPRLAKLECSFLYAMAKLLYLLASETTLLLQ